MSEVAYRKISQLPRGKVDLSGLPIYEELALGDLLSAVRKTSEIRPEDALNPSQYSLVRKQERIVPSKNLNEEYNRIAHLINSVAFMDLLFVRYYAEHIAPVSQAFFTAFTKTFKRKLHKSSILDIGCGPGAPVLAALQNMQAFIDSRARRLEFTYVGVDSSFAVFETLAPLLQSSNNAHFVKGEFPQLEAKREIAKFVPKFDNVITGGVVDYLPRPELHELVSGVADMIKPGGRLIVYVPIFKMNQGYDYTPLLAELNAKGFVNAAGVLLGKQDIMVEEFKFVHSRFTFYALIAYYKTGFKNLER
jgi:SAM-dependent methyltransferase